MHSLLLTERNNSQSTDRIIRKYELKFPASYATHSACHSTVVAKSDAAILTDYFKCCYSLKRQADFHKQTVGCGAAAPTSESNCKA
jgi:hypothetical protein